MPAEDNFDRFVTEFNGMVEVLADRMDQSECTKVERNLIYTDLLEKILARISGEDFAAKVFLKIDVPTSLPTYAIVRTIAYYQNIQGDHSYRIEKVLMIPHLDGTPERYRYQAYFEMVSNRYNGFEKSRFVDSEDEAMIWIRDRMERLGERIIRLG